MQASRPERFWITWMSKKRMLPLWPISDIEGLDNVNLEFYFNRCIDASAKANATKEIILQYKVYRNSLGKKDKLNIQIIIYEAKLIIK